MSVVVRIARAEARLRGSIALRRRRPTRTILGRETALYQLPAQSATHRALAGGARAGLRACACAVGSERADGRDAFRGDGGRARRCAGNRFASGGARPLHRGFRRRAHARGTRRRRRLLHRQELRLRACLRRRAGTCAVICGARVSGAASVGRALARLCDAAGTFAATSDRLISAGFRTAEARLSQRIC